MTLGALLLVGVGAALAAERIALPRVTLLVLAGIVVGPSGLDLLPPMAEQWHPMVSAIALMFVGFLLGARLRLSELKAHGAEIISVAAAKVIVSAVIVAGGLWFLGYGIVAVLLLAGISTATAPAAVQSVVQEMGAKGPFTTTIVGVVALDDAFGLALFAVLLSLAEYLTGDGTAGAAVVRASWDIGGAIVIGVAVGLPGGWLARRLRRGEPLEAEAIGIVILCGGLALAFETSYLIAAIALGTIVANMAEEQDEPFRIAAKAEWPLLIVFFVLSGAALDVSELATAGWLAVAYVVLRTVGLTLGSSFGAVLSNVPPDHRKWLGIALQPQAGVALGMALVGMQTFPEEGARILSIVVATTIVFELVGPIGTRLALVKTREASSTRPDLREHS